MNRLAQRQAPEERLSFARAPPRTQSALFAKSCTRRRQMGYLGGRSGFVTASGFFTYPQRHELTSRRNNTCVSESGAINMTKSALLMSRNIAVLIVALLFASTAASASNACIINGVAYVGIGAPYTSCWGSSDIGAQIMAAFNTSPSPGVRIKITAGTYDTSTNISFVSPCTPTKICKSVFVECDPGANSYPNGAQRTAGVTILKFDGMGATGPFFRFAAAAGSGMSNCTLVGPGGTSSTQGLVCGGPASDTSCIDNSFYNIDVSNFGVGLQFDNNAYIDFFYNPAIHDNGAAGENNIYAPNGIAGFGENISFYGGQISNKITPSATCINLLSGPNQPPLGSSPGVELHFYGLSLDQCGITMNTDGGGFLDLENVHMEAGISTNDDFITLGSTCKSCHLNISGGFMTEDHQPPQLRTELIALDSSQPNSANSISINGMMFQTGQLATYLVSNKSNTSTCCAQLYISGVTNGIGGSGVTSFVGGSWLSMNILSGGTVELGSFSHSATWGTGWGAPSGVCSTGSLYSNTAPGTPNLYVCQNGAWVGK